MKKPSGKSSSLSPVEAERTLFAAKLRAGRAVLNWSQTELGKRSGVTQRAIYRLELGATVARPKTKMLIENVFNTAGVEFQDTSDGGFKLVVPWTILRGSRGRGRRHN